VRVLVFGSTEWTDYSELIRQVTVLIDDRKHFYPEDKEYVFVHSAYKGAENMITEYIGKTEKFLRQKGYRIKEELFRNKNGVSDLSMLESEPDFVLIFGESNRTRSILKLLDVYEIPHRFIKE
jgi:hypothetical protein